MYSNNLYIMENICSDFAFIGFSFDPLVEYYYVNDIHWRDKIYELCAHMRHTHRT